MFKAHRLLNRPTLGSRVMKKKEELTLTVMMECGLHPMIEPIRKCHIRSLLAERRSSSSGVWVQGLGFKYSGFRAQGLGLGYLGLMGQGSGFGKQQVILCSDSEPARRFFLLLLH